ncbi:DUF1565 domain-containing protein [Leptospira sp. FAT2]|uniref:LIC10774 family surface protein n=1 Tax=Leptospira sanjuanensis TaxID=2879643 RepID=UPI001EE89A4A|nr:DUF1565 domain-containing protein [Leptospira sanjuanensis]MCG6193478.1 DUF1565 domain-containing protein [Leptospira sanjuanensis]
MKRLFLLCLSIILLLGNCSNEKENRESELTLLSGIIDSTDLRIPNPDSYNSQLILIRTPIYVNKTTGNDSWPGSQAAPLRTITKALALANGQNNIYIAPGEYSDRTGEIFPIRIPDGVSLIGDELGRGLGFSIHYDDTLEDMPVLKPTTIQFYGDDLGEAILPGKNSTIAGFNLPNPIALRTYNVKIRNNTLSQGIGIFNTSSSQPSGGHWISGNFIGSKKAPDYNDLFGIFFEETTDENKVENNRIYRNRYGIVIRPGAKVDLGGGSRGSVGNNTISCSLEIDLTLLIEPGNRLYAVNNRWDHDVPTYSVGSTYKPGIDIYAPPPYGTIDIGGYSLASNPCN